MTIVSILLPTYNRPKWLEESLDSLTEQIEDSFKIQLIIMDNGNNSDEVTKIINEYFEFFDESSVRIFKKENSLYNIPEMDRYVDGDFIIRFTDDDIMLPGSIRRKLDIMLANPSIGLCFSPAICIDENGTTNGLIKGSWPRRGMTFDELIPTSRMVMSATMIRKKPFLLPYECHPIGAEWGQHLKIVDAGWGVEYINEPLVKLRIHFDSDTYRRGIQEGMFIDMHRMMWDVWIDKHGFRPSAESWNELFGFYHSLLQQRYGFTTKAHEQMIDLKLLHKRVTEGK